MIIRILILALGIFLFVLVFRKDWKDWFDDITLK